MRAVHGGVQVILRVCGMNHRSAPVEVRERLAIPPDRLAQAVKLLKEQGPMLESAILSTCNRVELYAVMSQGCDCRELVRFLARFHGIDESSFAQFLYHGSGMDAAFQLFKVAASLDSMVIGEPQILGQVKQAYQVARDAGGLGKILTEVFDEAIRAGSLARSRTQIGKGAVSVSSISIELARKAVGDLEGKTVLIIGTGKISELSIRHLQSRGIRKVLVANRTFERAQELARSVGGEAIRFDALFEFMERADIVLSSTAAPHIIIHRAQVREVMERRCGRPLIFIDTAVPRDIDPGVTEIEGVHLYNIDDLSHVRDSNLQKKIEAARDVERIIQERMGHLIEKLNCSRGRKGSHAGKENSRRNSRKRAGDDAGAAGPGLLGSHGAGA